ncbi:MAG: hypothetical protein HN356_05060 [Calditrichaeota bacterium]|nr:hypothetical protein [Calditrichota bacterium]MBT7616617.1 hypothetical protein [Calditrichota bacterium]MBT7788487.1 hypothetical protein [Calditrichota bacterium]
MISIIKIIDILMLIFGVILISGCGEVPPVMPEVRGAVTVNAIIEINPDSLVIPESVFILLDGDSIGERANPYTFKTRVGEHLLSTFIENANGFYRSSDQRFEVSYDSIATVNTVMSSTGIVVVNSTIENHPTDSCSIHMDGVFFKTAYDQPFVMLSIPDGPHNISLATRVDTTEYQAWAEVTVSAAETTYVDLDLQMVSAYLGNHAPEINCLDMNGDTKSLSNHWGEVIFLYFFGST